jgi:aldehyde:ferredoxin oxidoreductase
MGGAGLVFDNLGVNMVAVVGRAPSPSILSLNRVHGEEIEVQLVPVDVSRIWKGRRGGVYSLMDHVYERFGGSYTTDPRVLAVGPAAQATDMGAIGSVPISRGKLTSVDTWAGRGGFGSKMLQQHGLAAIIYGGTFVDEDFRDRKVADQWFQDRYNKKLGAKDVEATVKYRYDAKFETGGTFGVNYATMGGRLLAFNYPTFTSATRSHTGSLQYFGDYPKYWNHPLCPCLPRCRQQSNKVQSQHALARSSDGIVGLARTFLYWNQVEREVGALFSSREGCRRVGREIKRYATVDCGSDTGRAWVCELSFVPGRESRERIQRRQR